MKITLTPHTEVDNLNHKVRWNHLNEAAQVLCISPKALKRRRDVVGGFLEQGLHWRFQTESPNSPTLWNVPLVLKEISSRSYEATRVARESRSNERRSEVTG